MGTPRHVNNLLSVFDLTACKALDLPENVSRRVIFIYDRKQKLKKFIITGNEVPNDIDSKLISWLEENIQIDDVAFGLKRNKLNADSFKKRTDGSNAPV